MIDKLGMLRQVLAGLQRIEGARPPAEAARPQDNAAPRTALPPQFSDAVRSRVAGIASDDPHRRRRALRIVIELALLREFGDGLEQDPAFHDTVDQVVRAMEQSPEAQNLVDAALDQIFQ